MVEPSVEDLEIATCRIDGEHAVEFFDSRWDTWNLTSLRASLRWAMRPERRGAPMCAGCTSRLEKLHERIHQAHLMEVFEATNAPALLSLRVQVLIAVGRVYSEVSAVLWDVRTSELPVAPAEIARYCAAVLQEIASRDGAVPYTFTARHRVNRCYGAALGTPTSSGMLSGEHLKPTSMKAAKARLQELRSRAMTAGVEIESMEITKEKK